MISHLEDNSVLVYLDETIQEKDVNKIKEVKADHGLIYSDLKVYHSQSGRHQSGVRSHELLTFMSSKAALGRLLVLRLKDEEVSKNISSVVNKWDPLRDQKIYEKAKQNVIEGMIILPTPFTNFMERQKDVGSANGIGRLALFRAFRAYRRNQLEIPLSKKKGVSCGNFVSYAIKVAIIEKFFPKGLPKDILEKIEVIESKKTNDQRKLSKIDPKEFEEFEKIVDRHLHFLDAKETKEISLTAELIKELYRSIKGLSISNFCINALAHPDLWGISGYVFYREHNNKQEPWVMSHEAYLNFRNVYKKHNMLITDEELTKAGITIKPMENKKVFNL